MEAGTKVKIRQAREGYTAKKYSTTNKKGTVIKDYGKFILVQLEAGYKQTYWRDELVEI